MCTVSEGGSGIARTARRGSSARSGAAAAHAGAPAEGQTAPRVPVAQYQASACERRDEARHLLGERRCGQVGGGASAIARR